MFLPFNTMYKSICTPCGNIPEPEVGRVYTNTTRDLQSERDVNMWWDQ